MIKTAWKLRGKIKAESQLFTIEEPPPPPIPLAENHFSKKPLADMGPYPPFRNGNSAKLLRKFFS